MLVTSYGGLITFGWEFESTDLNILDWYAPSTPASDWPADPAKQRDWVRERQTRGKWGPGKTHNWGQFNLKPPGSGAPTYLNPVLEQEIFNNTWELSPGSGAYAGSVDALFTQLDTVRNKFPRPANEHAKGFQVHIVFEAPNGSAEDKAYWHARIAALYRLLNDYAALKSYKHGARSMTGNAFTGASVENPDKLAKKLGAAALELETQDDNGAWVGKYKFHKVGMRREVYGGDSRLGLEIRSGWKTDWGRFRALVEKVVVVLGNLDSTHHVKRNQPDGAANFYLEQHLEFCQHAPLISDKAATALRKFAGIIVNRKFRDTKEGERPDLPFVASDTDDFDLNGAAKIVYKRWMIAFMPWESHPAFIIDAARCKTIVDARKRLERKISEFWDANNATRAKDRNDPSDISIYFKTFFTTTQIEKYL